MSEDDLLWAVSMEHEHAWVMHVPTHTIDRVKAFHEAKTFISPVNKQPVKDPVIEFEGGSTFLCIESNFIRLSDNEAGFYVYAQQGLKALLSEMVQKAAQEHIPPATIGVLLSSVLRTQFIALMGRFPADQTPPSPPPSPSPGTA